MAVNEVGEGHKVPPRESVQGAFEHADGTLTGAFVRAETPAETPAELKAREAAEFSEWQKQRFHTQYPERQW